MTDRSLSDLDPSLQPTTQQWLDLCAAAKLNVRITVTWRSADDQGAAYDKGLSNAKAGQSPHGCCIDGKPASRAFDFAVFSDGQYITDGTDPRYRQAGEIGKSLGLEYGGDWHHPDWDHLEMRDWKII